MENTGVRYSLDGLSPSQAGFISEALELATRLGLGQIDYLLEYIKYGGVTDEEGKLLPFEKIAEAGHLVSQLRRVLTGFDPGRSKGIGSPAVPAKAAAAYEIGKVIRHRLAWDRNPRGGIGVDYDDPYLLKYTDEPRVALNRADASGQAPHEQLPPGCYLGPAKGGWSVIRHDGEEWVQVSVAPHAAAAVAQAREKLGLVD